MVPGEPSLFSHEDPRQYLRAVIRLKKQRTRGCTLTTVARKAGFRSPSSLSMFLHGKRTLKPAAAEKLAKALQLVPKQRHYLVALAERESAKSFPEKMEAEARLISIRNQQEEQSLELPQYRFLSVWYYPVIYVLVGMSDFRDEPEWIARRLRGPVSAAQVKVALDDLVKLKLIEKKDGHWVQTLGAVTTGEDVGSAAIYQYHRKMLGLAHQALSLRPEKREFNGLTVGIPKKVLPEVKQRIRDFRKELNEYLSQYTEPCEVYQLSLQLFPLTEGEGT